MGSITDTELPENFSFSCYELDSTIFNDDNDNESFIEINLEETRDFKEFEIRISISSVSVAEFCSKGLYDELCHEGQGSSASDGKTRIPFCSRSEVDASVLISTAEISRRREVPKRKFPSLNRKVRFRGTVNGHPEFFCRGRNPSKMVTAFNSGMMKLFMKLRSGNILTTFMSLIKSYHSFSHQSSRQSSGRITQEIRIYGRLITNPFHRWWPQINNAIAKRRGNHMNNSDGNLSINKLKELEVGSSPSSINSSPIRRDFLNQRTSFSERENSVRAAIDHCKRLPHDALEYCNNPLHICKELRTPKRPADAQGDGQVEETDEKVTARTYFLDAMLKAMQSKGANWVSPVTSSARVLINGGHHWPC